MTKYAHGTRERFRNGCRCDTCRRGNADYWQARNDWMKGRGKPPVTDADEARRHLMGLVSRGLRMVTIEKVTGIPRPDLSDIIKRRRRVITSDTGLRILGLDAEDLDRLPDELVIPSGPTWARMERLCRKSGWTLRQGAQQLGYKSGMTRRPGITVRNARKVRTLYAQVCGIRCAICGEPLAFHPLDRRCRGKER